MTERPARDHADRPAGDRAGRLGRDRAEMLPVDPAATIWPRREAGARPIASFYPRGGRLTDRQAAAYQRHAERWVLDPGALPVPLDPIAIFGRSGPFVLEIGCGMGDATAAMAAARPEVNLLGLEVFKPGIAQTLHHLAEVGADNVRLLRADAVAVLQRLVAPAGLDEVWVFFPDPWPKQRHHKRRLVSGEFAELVASRLRPGGRWRLATDWPDYAARMLAVADASAELFHNPHHGYAPRPAFRPNTRFERRGLRDERPIRDLELVRR